MSHDRYDKRFARSIANKTMAELMQIRSAIEANPDNRNPKGGIQIYTAKARGKLNAIAYAVQNLLTEKRKT